LVDYRSTHLEPYSNSFNSWVKWVTFSSTHI